MSARLGNSAPRGANGTGRPVELRVELYLDWSLVEWVSNGVGQQCAIQCVTHDPFGYNSPHNWLVPICLITTFSCISRMQGIWPPSRGGHGAVHLESNRKNWTETSLHDFSYESVFLTVRLDPPSKSWNNTNWIWTGIVYIDLIFSYYLFIFSFKYA